MDDDRQTINDREWAQRRLCSDESCIGVIGPDGRCKECGKKYAGVLPAGGGNEPDLPPPQDKSPDPADAAVGDDVAPTDDEWAQRRLCSDESCIGVIGPDGRCKECGKPAE